MPKAVVPPVLPKVKAPKAKVTTAAAAPPVRKPHPKGLPNGRRSTKRPGMAVATGPGSTGPQVGSNYTALTPLVVEAFLHSLAGCANVTQVCDELRINRLTIYYMKNQDPKFLERFNLAMERGHDAWEDEATRRAFRGYKRPVYQQGQHVGDVTEYSDALAQMMMRGSKPEKYRERSTSEMVIKGGAVVKIESMTDDDLNQAINNKLNNLGAIGTMDKIADNRARAAAEALAKKGTL